MVKVEAEVKKFDLLQNYPNLSISKSPDLTFLTHVAVGS